MRLAGDGSTNRELLSAVADWQNHAAWHHFRCTYDPVMLRWCHGYGLDADSINEVRQRIWIELADRMKTFEYDPNRTFRGWLRRLCQSRVLNYLRQRKGSKLLAFDERVVDSESVANRSSMDAEGSDEGDQRLDPLLLQAGERAQQAVRAKVMPRTWDAFWLVAVCDWSVERTAKSLGLTHIAVYAARKRVARMLIDEGKRMSDG